MFSTELHIVVLQQKTRLQLQLFESAVQRSFSSSYAVSLGPAQIGSHLKLCLYFEEARSRQIFSAGDRDNERRAYCMGSANTVSLVSTVCCACTVCTRPINNRNFFTVSSFHSLRFQNYFYAKILFLHFCGLIFLCESHGLIFFWDNWNMIFFMRVQGNSELTQLNVSRWRSLSCYRFH